MKYINQIIDILVFHSKLIDHTLFGLKVRIPTFVLKINTICHNAKSYQAKERIRYSD